MKTIKLPYVCENKTLINKLINQSSSMIKIAYNRFKDGYTEKEIRNLSKSYNNIELLNSWLIQCAIKKAKYLFEKDIHSEKTTIFGGKFNFKQRSQQRISKQEFKSKTYLPICSQGEKSHNANRMFTFNLTNNKIIFKANRQNHIELLLPKLRKNYKNEFKILQQLIEEKQITISVELTGDFIYLTYDDTILKLLNYEGNKNIVAAIDMNPEYIGFSITHFTPHAKILFKQVIDVSHYIKNVHKTSYSKENKHQINKQKHELIQICKYLIQICKRYNVGKFIIEDLNFKSNKLSNKECNRKNKNKWNRVLLIEQIKKRCKLNNITLVEINPCYTSFIGNLLNNEPDMLAASLEIARRGYYKFQKGKFYPDLIRVEDLGNRWKEALNWTFSNWIQLFQHVKTAKLKYRNSLEDFSFKVCRLNSSKSFIKLYSFV